MDRPDDRPIVGVDPDHRMQIKTATAAGADHRRILNGQNMPIRAAAGRAQGRFIDHRLRIDRSMRKNRLKPISPARLPPSLRTRIPWPAVAIRRSSKNAPLFPGDGRQTALKSPIVQFSCLQQENQNPIP
ncbi:hypothetical protein [Rhizobium etli]|uniref:hypothetical protein n=1 Tax=Rhizobium etli TaxID=29449 RepID=UPI00042452F7|nr:hypothetical protein [Rhizobium etli]